MSTEKTFNVVGTTVMNGVRKMRFANDLASRVKHLAKGGHTEIDLIELPRPMTKLEATEYFVANRTLSLEQQELAQGKIAEKSKAAKRTEVTATLTKNVKNRIKDKTPTDPRVEKFVEANANAESAE